MYQIAPETSRQRPADIVLLGVAVGLAVTTGYLHSTLGGLLFTLNAIGFVTLAAAQITFLPLPLRYRLLPKLALAGMAAATIGGWILFGARYSTGYLATAIEIAILAILAVDLVREHGGPVSVAQQLLAVIADARSVVARRARRLGPAQA